VDDATYIVFGAGNTEIIGIRDRLNQTLYISPVIQVDKSDNPPYARLHTALFIAAYNDALNRAKQLREMEASNWLLNVPSRYRLWLDRSPPMKTPSGLAVDERPKMDDEVRERCTFTSRSLLIFLRTEHLS